MKAFGVWKDGEKWYMLHEADGTPSHAVATKEEAIAEGAAVFFEDEEPRFLVRDESGRGWACERPYSSFDQEEREYMEETYDIDGNQEENQTLGEWLDSSSAGDEFANSDQMLTIIRIN